VGKMSDENNLWECDKKKINKEFSNPVGKLIKDIKVDVERQNTYNCGRKQGAVDALNSVEFRQLLLQAKVTELENQQKEWIYLELIIADCSLLGENSKLYEFINKRINRNKEQLKELKEGV
jgi:hypothetical protein